MPTQGPDATDRILESAVAVNDNSLSDEAAKARIEENFVRYKSHVESAIFYICLAIGVVIFAVVTIFSNQFKGIALLFVLEFIALKLIAMKCSNTDINMHFEGVCTWAIDHLKKINPFGKSE